MEEENFSPRTYNFELPGDYVESFCYWDLNSYEVACPNSSTLLDHTLAVIWHIFNDDGVELYNLNRADVSWALKFLESIDTKDAGDTSDLEQLIKLLRNFLITRYAMEDESFFTKQNETILESINQDLDSTSYSLDEYMNSPEVQEDIGKSISLVTMSSETKCTKAEMLQKLKGLEKDSNNEMSLNEAIKLLEKS